MKHRQVTAVLLSIIVAASACVPIDAFGVYAAESAGSTAVATVMEQDEAEAEEQSRTESDAILEQATDDRSEEELVAESFEAADAAGTIEDDKAADAAAGTEEGIDVSKDDAAEASDAEDDDAATAAEDAALAAGTTEEASEDDATAASEEVPAAAATAAEAATSEATTAATDVTLPPLIEIIESDSVMESGGR